jgi:hypothetical protein
MYSTNYEKRFFNHDWFLRLSKVNCRITSSIEVKNEWKQTYTTARAFIGVYRKIFAIYYRRISKFMSNFGWLVVYGIIVHVQKHIILSFSHVRSQGVKLGATYLPSICKISTKSMIVSPLIHVWPNKESTCCLCWTALVGKKTRF